MKLWLQISTVLLSVLTAWGDRNSEKLLKLAGFSSSQSRNLEINGFGTGFAVSPDGYLISASHVTEGCDAVRVLFKKGEFLDARVVREEPQLDLVFLKVDIPTPSYLSVTNRTSSLGDDVYTIGYPTPQIMGFNQKFTKGSISALTGIYDSSFRYQISVPIQPGNSGGPVICEETGEVIGIVVSFLNDEAVEFIPQNVNYALKSGFIKPIKLGKHLIA
jgi:serine protease Do